MILYEEQRADAIHTQNRKLMTQTISSITPSHGSCLLKYAPHVREVYLKSHIQVLYAARKPNTVAIISSYFLTGSRSLRA